MQVTLAAAQLEPLALAFAIAVHRLVAIPCRR